MDLVKQFNTLPASVAAPKSLLVQYGPTVLTAVLVVACAAKLASMTWLLLDKPQYDATAAAASNTASPAAPSAGATDGQVSAIQNANLFGAYVPPSETPVVAEQSFVPETSLTDLTLKGTVASTTNDNGLAIIERSGEENVYLVGDDIAPGISLSRVFATEIHLSRSGVIEKLLLPKLTEGASVSRPANNRQAARPAARQVVSSRNARSNIPTKLGDLMRPQPVFQGGKMQGYRVYPGRKREQFKALGLKPGDLVTEVNGTPLEDPSRGLEIFRSLSENTQVSVTVQRNGAQTSLVLDTSQLNLGDQ
ncbi:MAG: type II secretion system protein GspC [Pseudomonadota bacterium]